MVIPQQPSKSPPGNGFHTHIKISHGHLSCQTRDKIIGQNLQKLWLNVGLYGVGLFIYKQDYKESFTDLVLRLCIFSRIKDLSPVCFVMIYQR